MEVSYLKVHEPVIVHCIMRQELNQAPFIFLSLLVLAVGSTLLGLRLGGDNGMILTGASTGGGIIAVGLVYVMINEALKRRQNYTPKELMDRFLNCSNIPDVMNRLTKESLVKMIDFICQNNLEYVSILPKVCYHIVTAPPRKDIQGRIKDVNEYVQDSIWSIISEAYVAAHPQGKKNLENLQTIELYAKEFADSFNRRK